jgi:hypothetical protein
VGKCEACNTGRTLKPFETEADGIIYLCDECRGADWSQVTVTFKEPQDA